MRSGTWGQGLCRRSRVSEHAWGARGLATVPVKCCWWAVGVAVWGSSPQRKSTRHTICLLCRLWQNATRLALRCHSASTCNPLPITTFIRWLRVSDDRHMNLDTPSEKVGSIVCYRQRHKKPPGNAVSTFFSSCISACRFFHAT